MQEKLKWYVGKYIDFDGAYKAQCMDLAVDYLYWATDGKYRMWGNAVDAVNDRVNNFGNFATIHRNTKNFLPKIGDIAVWTKAPAHEVYGHIGIVYGDITLQSCTMLDQNWNGNPSQPAKLRKDDYRGVTHFIRINFEGEAPKTKKAKVTKVTKKHLIVAGHGGRDVGAVGNGINERDFTRDEIVDRVAKYINQIDGHEAVVYNKKNNMYVDTQYGVGYGMYWAKAQGFDTVTEYHLDAFNKTASGGHVIVYKGFAPDSIDLGIRNILKKYVGVRYNHKGHSGVSGRDNLLQVNVSADIGMNYRLVELGFITNPTDVRNIKNNVKAICKGMAEAITGGKVKKQQTPKKKPNTNNATTKKDERSKTPRTIGKWQVNKQNGAQYIRAEGTFTVTAEEGIISRFDNPSTNAEHGGVAKKGYTYEYSYLVRANGFVWIQYRLVGTKRWKFLPFNTWNSVTGAVGKVPYGTFS